MGLIYKFLINKKVLLALILCSVILSIINLFNGYSLVGKTFPGFGVEFSLTFSPTSMRNHWTGNDSGMKEYDYIITVNNKRVHNINDFKNIIGMIPHDTNVTYGFIRNGKYLTNTVKTMRFSFGDFIDEYLILFFISLVYIFLALIAVLKGDLTEKSYVLTIFNILSSLYFTGFSNYGFIHQFFVLFFILPASMAILNYLGILLITPEKRYLKKIGKLNTVLGFLITGIMVLLYFILKSSVNMDISLLNIFLYLHELMIIYVSLCNLAFFVTVLYAYFKTKDSGKPESIQLRIIVTGGILGFFPICVLWFIPWFFSSHVLIPLSQANVVSSVFPILTGYAILRYKAFDIEIYIRKGLLYFLLTILLIFVYFITFSVMGIYLEKLTFVSDKMVIIIFAFIVFLGLNKLKDSVQNMIDKYFYRQKTDLQELLNQYISRTTNVINKIELTELTFSYLEKAFNPDFIAIYTVDEKGVLNLLSTSNGDFSNQIENKPYKVYDYFSSICASTDIIITDLYKEKNLLGILILGPKKSEVEYLPYEKAFIKNFSQTLSNTLDTVIIAENSIELTLKNLKIQNKLNLINELTSDLAHDLKSPVVSCYNAADAFQFKMEQITNPDKNFIMENISKLSKSIGKIDEYIHLCIDREMINAGKLRLREEFVNVKIACNDALYINSDFVNKKRIQIIEEFPEQDILIYGDRIRFEHTISNLISNAMKYCKTYLKVKVNLNENKKILISVEDDGNGIKEEIRNKIFERGNIDESFKDIYSTGIGLDICKKYIEMMKGKIWFETFTGKGTKFFIELPLFEQ